MLNGNNLQKIIFLSADCNIAEENITLTIKDSCKIFYRGQASIFIFLFLLLSSYGKSQSVKELFANSGIWQDYSYPVLSAKTYPEIKGRLVNTKWSEIETSPNVWNWNVFDQDIKDHTADGLPVIFMVYTGMNAPQWLYTNGVPKVNISNGNYAPYYLDADYNFYFKRMITQVRQHVQTLSPSLRNLIIGVQACFANTGDQLSYQGDVPQQYEISDEQFDSLFKVYSSYYYNEYNPLVPAIKMLSNPNYYDPSQQYWLDDNCPGGWTKCGTIGKGFQLNTELDKQSWLFDIMNKPVSGQYVRSRCEINGSQLYAGWWTKSPVKNLYALMCYDVYWGLDWSNQITDYIEESKYDSCLRFFNKYAWQKVPGVATNALCALKDVLDAADVVRFPESVYGNADRDNTSRYVNIYNKYITYGAELEDKAAVTGNEYDCLSAKGTNDVGWSLLPGNYERYLHQIDANITSAGYWNVNPENKDGMYGRFARGFDLSKSKNALYFDVEDGFLRSAPLNGKYAVTIDVIYYDNGNGSWQLFYDAQSNSNKASVNVMCGNTKTWKKKSITLSDAYFGNRSIRNSDFYIKSTNSSNVIFSTVELSRPSQSAVGFITTPLPSFDTVCLNGASGIQSFVMNAAYLNGTTVQVGPFNGYTFSKSSNGPFYSSLNYTGYGTQINSTVYVQMNTSKAGVFNGKVPITGGGVTAGYVNVTGTVSSTSPLVNAVVKQISCFNKNDGSIDLQITGGGGPFIYSWSSSEKKSWHETTQDIYNLKEANYTVQVFSDAGCSTSKTYSIVEPDKLKKPSGINGPSSVNKQQTVNFSVKNPDAFFKYIWTVPSGASILSGQTTSAVNVRWGSASGNITVKAQDNCSTTSDTKKYVSVKNSSNAFAETMLTNTETYNHALVMPNPAKDILTIQFDAEKSFAYTIHLTDLSGKLLNTKKVIAYPGRNYEKLYLQQLASGNYFITLFNTNGDKQTLQFVKE